MTLTLREFDRQLRPLLAGWSVDRLAEGWRLRQEARTVEICCRPLPALPLGALALPRLAVSIAFAGSEPLQEAAFIDDFMPAVLISNSMVAGGGGKDCWIG